MESLVELIDYMGSDLTVVNSARVSFSKHVSTFTKKDEELIKYLSENDHFTPFTHCEVTLRIKMPIFVVRQWFKSTVGFTRNEVSRRYVDSKPEFFYPDFFRKRSPSLKQGSLPDSVENNEVLFNLYSSIIKESEIVYNRFIEEGVAPELARIVLPQSMYTEFYETASLFAYARLYNLRREGTHAQIEIQEYAEEVGKIMKNLFPISWKYLTEKEDK